MNRLLATVKVPADMVDEIKNQLRGLGVRNIESEMIPYEQFKIESRMNYDCVFEEAWSDGKAVAYLYFGFEDNEEGRKQAYSVEYAFKQIPLNLHYQDLQ